MEKVATKIRKKLKQLGYSNRKVSVRCHQNYTIHINSKIQITGLVDIVTGIYHERQHSWLCVCVDNQWLPMP